MPGYLESATLYDAKPKDVFISPFFDIRVNWNRVGFASVKERLAVPATLTHRRPLETHLLRAFGQQGSEP